MPVNLLAICRTGAQFVLKRVKTTADVQDLLDGVFATQEQAFFEGIDQEIPFDGGWKPDKNEIMLAAVTAEISAIRTAAMGNITALPELNSANFLAEGVRALAVLRAEGDASRLLLQNFSARQILDRHLAFIWDGDTFNRLTAPTFSIATNLAGVLDAAHIKFKSFSNIKMIFDLANLYQEASDTQIDQFAQHASLQIEDVTAFKVLADQTIRKLVHAVIARNVLGTYDMASITTAAQQQTFDLTVHNNKVVFPADRAGVKRLMHFLDESFYRGALSGEPYITNSKRRA